jgi:ligand-binding sensor domain-containing protein/two-component sensor histidine kinase
MQQRPLIVFSFLVIIMLYIVSPAKAQYAENNFTRYTVKDGLSDNNILCLQQDDQGYMWIGTDAGLNRFDGNSFKKFFRGTAPLQLPSISISRLKHFGTNQLGIISKGGFQLLNTQNYSIQNYRVPDSSAISVYVNAAWDAVELQDNSYAVTTAAGFYRFNDKGKLLYRHDAYGVNDIGRKRILYGRDFFKLSDKLYLVYVNEAGLAIFDIEKKIFRELGNKQANPDILLHSPFQQEEKWSVKYQLSKDEFLFIRGGANTILYYNHSQKKQVVSPLPFRITDSLNWESKIVKLNDSMLAINSSTNGFYLLKINRQTGIITADGIKYLRNYKILCLFTDKDNRLWAGTLEGLLKQELRPPVINAWHYQPAGGEKYTGGFSTVYRHKDKLYAGRFSYSKGLAIIDPYTMKVIKEIDFFSDKTNWNEVRSIEMYHPDTLWIGTNAGLLWFDTKSERYGKLLDEKKYEWAAGLSAVLAPARNDGYAWICGFLGGKVVRYHIPTRTFTLFTSQTIPALPFEKVKHIVYDSYGDVWIAGHSLARWNNRKNKFDTLITVYGGANKYNDDIVTIRADDNGSLWMHNAYNGLLEYKIKEKQFVAWSMKDGLPSDMLSALSPVIDNKLWVAGNNQLCLFDIQTKQFTVYDYRDGLPEHRPTAKRIYQDVVSGLLYLCSNEYLVQFPISPEKEKNRSSELAIEEITVDNKHTYYRPQDAIHIRHNENNLIFNFSIIDFEKSNYQFAWRLNKAEQWNVIGNQRSISLSNLPPGNYTLELKASGKPGVEKTKSFSFTIKPPFWKTTWFIASAALLIGGGIYFFYRNRIRHIRQKADIDKQLSQTELKALQAQMNPHFIFNSLNSIREMILNNENKDASHYLSKFAHLIRITLDQSAQSLVSLRNTVDYLQRYMEMEKIRNNQFTFKVNVGENIDQDETLIPPMLIQPFIENGLWHGVAANNRAIHITIHFKKENNYLFCTVEDNGIGLNQSEKNKTDGIARHKSHGISNIKKRIELINEKYNLQCKVRIQDKQDITGSEGTGTQVIICLPLEINDV